MALYELTHDSFTALKPTTMEEQSFSERDDLQRLLKTSMNALGEELFVLSEEVSPWTDSQRRIDLLAIDRKGNIVVVELKRTEDGGHMELQAIRYAAMVANMTFKQAVMAHQTFLGGSATDQDATAAILKFLDRSEPAENFAKECAYRASFSGFFKGDNHGSLVAQCKRSRYQMHKDSSLRIGQQNDSGR